MPITFSEPSYFVEVREIATLVPMSHLLGVLGFSVNYRSHRCACILHEGSNPSAFSWTEAGLWKCYRYGAGGDKITLVRATRKCSFREAIAFLAALAGVELSKNERPYAEIEQSRQQREAEERTASFLAEIQHNLYLELGRELDSLHKIPGRAGAKLTTGQRQELYCAALRYTETAYCIAAFAPPLDRANFALHPHERSAMVAAALERGYVSDAKGYRFEVPLQ